MTNQFRNKIVTVFGGSGFLGRYLVKRLAESGARIRVAIRRPDEGLFLKPMGAVGQIDLVQANIRYPRSVAHAVQGAHIVVNFVGILSPSGAQGFEAVHARGAHALAEAAQAAGVPTFVHVSALGADPDSPSRYARTKAVGEQAVRAIYPRATIFRPSVVFGPEDDFFNRFGAMARNLPVLPLIGGGHTRFQPVYVADVAEAIMAVLADRADGGETYELGGPRIYTFRELMEIVRDVTGRRPILAPLPFGLASMIGTFAGLLPNAPITADQVELLKRDNVVSEGAKGFAELGIARLTPVEGTVEAYLTRFRRGGQKVAPRFS